MGERMDFSALRAADERLNDPLVIDALMAFSDLLAGSTRRAWRGNFKKSIAEIDRLMTSVGWHFEHNRPERSADGKYGYSAPVFVVTRPYRIAICVDHKRPHAKSVLLLSRAHADLKLIVLAATSWYDYALDRRYIRQPSVAALHNIHALLCVDPALSIQTMDTVARRARHQIDFERHTPDVLDLVRQCWDSGSPLNWRADVDPARHFERVLFDRFGWHPDVIRSFWHRIQASGLAHKSRNRTAGLTGLCLSAATPAADPSLSAST